ncbi:MAG: tail-specific protease [Bacteroidetes bacterium]|nr:MAG: tail-specific protease [Bacteroidota bacterium]
MSHMRKVRVWVAASALAAFFVFSSYVVHYSDGDKSSTLVRVMLQGIQYYHYNPQVLDDKFSKTVFDEYLQQLDYNKRLLTQADVDALRLQHETRIDDELKEGGMNFCDESAAIFKRRVEQAHAFSKEILSAPFTFTGKETLETEPKNMGYAANDAELKARWEASLKFFTLARLSDMLDRQEKPDFKGEKKTIEQLEAEARAKVLKNQEDYFRRISHDDITDHQADYLNVIASIYDPHTGFFPPEDKENFDISMSGRLEGIGAQLIEEDGYVKISNVVPGGAASRQGQLQANDLILKVAQGREEPVDIVGMSVDEAVKLIRGPKGTEVTLTVRKIDGVETTIPIIRDIVELEETYAKSALLREEGSKALIGYIYLPKFYADFQDPKGRRCATDVKREIEKLKSEGITGMILDLRDNGGGSLQDVVDMTGLFIEKGPVVQVKSRNTEPQILADRDPSVLYDGALVVLVNSFSASASEIMAAAIQDYGRGVIIGSSSTFGKGTVQRFYDLDDFVRTSNDVKPLGQIKLTTQKFYRINGGATQLRGVVPDLVLPDQYSQLEMGEKDQEHSMAWDEISPVPYQSWKNSVAPRLNKIRSSSQNRVQANPTFALINENADRLKRRQDQSVYSLNIDEYRADQKELDAESERYKNLFKEIPGLSVKTPTADAPAIQSDSVKVKRNNTWHESLRKDVYVYEAMQVLKDLDK